MLTAPLLGRGTVTVVRQKITEKVYLVRNVMGVERECAQEQRPPRNPAPRRFGNVRRHLWNFENVL